MNCLDVDARKAAGSSVNVSKLSYSVRLYVCVEASVTVNEMYDALFSIWTLKVCQTMSCIVYSNTDVIPFYS